jgi:hypothetical protein
MKLMVNRGEGSSSEIVSVVQASESRHGDDLGTRDRPLDSRSPHRGLLVQPQMHSVFMLVPDVFTHHAPEMTLVQSDQVVMQMAAASVNSSLSNAVLRRAFMPPLVEVSPHG